MYPHSNTLVKHLRLVCLPLYFWIVLFASQASANYLFIGNVHVIDVLNRTVLQDSFILIKDDRIVRVDSMKLLLGSEASTDLSFDNSPFLSQYKPIKVIDAKGSYVLPGLIDAHVHVGNGPAVVIDHPSFPNESNWLATWGADIPSHLKAYLASGVTTIVDLAEPFFVIRRIQQYLEKNPGPRFIATGPMISAPGGYGPVKIEVANEADINQVINSIKAANGGGLKLTLEIGFSPVGWPKLPAHSDSMLELIKQKTTASGLPIYAHATSVRDFSTAIEMKVHAITHVITGRYKTSLPQELIEKMAKRGIYQISTLSLSVNDVARYHPHESKDQLTKTVVPAKELLRAKDPDLIKQASKLTVNYAMPFLSDFWQERFADSFWMDRFYEESLKHSMATIKALHDAGTPIVLGSDAAQTVTLTDYHGIKSLREMEMLKLAGLSEWEVLAAATINPARMLGLEQEIGSIQQGKVADLVLLNENPLDDIRNMRSVIWTVRDGVAKTPAQWVE